VTVQQARGRASEPASALVDAALSAEAVARGLVGSALRRPTTLGNGRLVCVDGPAGSGKTTLAAALERQFRDGLRGPGIGAGQVEIVHMDDLFAGWTGLDAGMETLASSVVAPLRAGRPGRYRRYDWHRGAFAEERVVGPCEVLVVEGVGSGNAAYADAITCLVWVHTPPDVRLARGLERDGEAMRADWLRWHDLEQEMFTRHRTRERADVVVDGAR
jgi:uridine kinase